MNALNFAVPAIIYLYSRCKYRTGAGSIFSAGTDLSSTGLAASRKGNAILASVW